MTTKSLPSRRAQLFVAASTVSLLIAAPGHAQQGSAAGAWKDTPGIRLDQSQVRGQPIGPNQEREGVAFDALQPSAVNVEETRTVAQAPPAPAVRTVTQEARLDGTTFASGRADLTPTARARLDALVGELRGKTGLRIDIAGHTDNQRISAGLRSTFADNQALSEARARAVAAYLAEKLGLPEDVFTTVGYGESQPIADNRSPEGMAQNRRTVIRVSYEAATEAAVPTPPMPVVTRVEKDDCAPPPKSDLPFSISVDGQPVGVDTTQHEADRQRCVDVALDKSDIQIKYDPMNVAPALNAWAAPGAVRRGEDIVWRTYSNYAWWVKKAEIRVFMRGQSTADEPAAIIPVTIGGEARWLAPIAGSPEVGYVLRVYDEKGRFDETALKTVQLLNEEDPDISKARAERDALSGYGENSLKIRNITASGGAVTISGAKIHGDQSVTAMGMPVPVDDHGRFVFRQILPSGPHQVSVAVKDGNGRVATFQRNLSIADKDWFYVAMADITAANGRTTGPAPIVTGDDYHYDKKTTFDGRTAFYLKGKVLGKYLLTASADTKEQPLKDLFSNFGSKDPNYLLRRIDPNRYYPVYGDDSVIVDDAPTQGKFYVRLERDSSYVMWGNFQTSWTGTELTQYSRGLYGGDLVWNSQATTGQGERKTQVEAFAAEPGTLTSREEFRGTGGSLYYLRRQDLTEGSERLWVEIRDKDSGIVMQRTLLTPVQDYDIDYLQGRLTLRAPLPTSADGSQLVQTSTLNGDPVYLVATYEYVPGLTAVHGSTVGVRASQWLNDAIRVGGTYYKQGEGGMDQTLEGLDATLRYKPGTWIKGEAARSKGAGAEALSSLTGGFDFTQNTTSDEPANAYRVDAAVDLADLHSVLAGRVSAYWQERDAGFSGPGLITPGGEGLRQAGIAAVLPLGTRAEIALKADDRNEASLGAESEEVAVRYKVNAQWGVSAGVRRDDYRTGSDPSGALYNASPTLSRNGERTDAVVRFDFRPLASGQDQAIRSAGAGAAADLSRYGGAGVAGQTNTVDLSGPTGSLLSSGLVDATGQVTSTNDPTAAAGIAAAQVPGLKYRSWNAYGYVQQTISASGERLDNDRVGVGAGWQANSRLRLSGELSGGDGGTAGKISGDYAIDNRSNLYLTYARETETPDLNYAGAEGVLTAGGRMRLTERLGIFAEERQTSGEGPRSLTHGFGVDFAPAKNWTTGLRLETGSLSDPVAGDLKRDAVSLTVGYKNADLKWLSLAEFRRDRTTTLGTVEGTCVSSSLSDGTDCGTLAGADNRRTVLLKNTVSYQATASWRLIGTLNLSRSTSSQGDFYDGDYTEAVVGAAYRPVSNDRWNTLFKYTYFYNLPSSAQVDGYNNGPLDYTQKSHVLDIDTIFDVRPWLSIGAKYGLRVGELRDSRTDDGQWYDSQAQLWVVRGDLHFVRNWDALLEFRTLSVKEADDRRSGILAGVYRHVGDHAKIGVGYNFTDFSDDLTDLSYRSRGFFINALATF